MGVLRRHDLGLRDYTRDYDTGVVEIPPSARNVLIEIERPAGVRASSLLWDDGAYIEVEVVGSWDDGKTWTPMGGCGAIGGQHVTRHGTVAQLSTVRLPWPGGGQARLHVRQALGRCRTRVTLTADDTPMRPDPQGPIHHSIAFVAAARQFSGANVASLTTASWTISGTNRYLIGGAASGAGTRTNVSSMKWGGSGGADLTLIGSQRDVDPYWRMSQWGRVAPAASTTTFYAAWSSNQDETAMGAIAFEGVDQSTPIGTQAFATGTTTNPSLNVTSVAGDEVVDLVWAVAAVVDNHTIAATAGQTSRVEVEGTDLGFEALGMSHKPAVGTSTTMSWTNSNAGTNGWGHLGVPLKTAAGGGSPTLPQLERHQMRGAFRGWR